MVSLLHAFFMLVSYYLNRAQHDTPFQFSKLYVAEPLLERDFYLVALETSVLLDSNFTLFHNCQYIMTKIYGPVGYLSTVIGRLGKVT